MINLDAMQAQTSSTNAEVAEVRTVEVCGDW